MRTSSLYYRFQHLTVGCSVAGLVQANTRTFRIRNLPKVLALVAGVILYGCSQTIPMSRPNTTADQAKSDNIQCQREAGPRYPVAERDLNAGKITTNCTTYKNQTSCTSAPSEPLMYDDNAISRWNYVYSCMAAKGSRSLPKETTRHLEI